MELELLKTSNLSKRKRNWILLLAALGITGYGAYRVYHIPAIARKRKRFFKLLKSLISIVESVSDSAEVIGVLSKDMKQFLQSDSDQIPTSVKQIAKITKSKEFSESMIRVTEALTVGVLSGFNSESRTEEEEPNRSSFSDRLLDKLFSNAGSGFASVVVGSFARSMVMAFYSENPSGNSNSNDDVKSAVQMGVISRPGSDFRSVPSWVSVVCSDKCRELIGDSIQLFVSTAVAVYLEKTMDINTYDEFFSGLTNPKHESKVKDFLVSVCNGAVETLVKTSHHVLKNASSANSEEVRSLSGDEVVDHGSSSSNKSHDGSSVNPILCAGKDRKYGEESFVDDCKGRSSFDEIQQSGWVDKVSYTLSVPGNRRFLLDVTGRVTFETVRSFLDFLLWKLSGGLKKGFRLVNGGAVEKGLEVMRYAGAKSIVVATVCLALCLHVLVGARVLTPA